jgi:hypothetical protein
VKLGQNICENAILITNPIAIIMPTEAVPIMANPDVTTARSMAVARTPVPVVMAVSPADPHTLVPAVIAADPHTPVLAAIAANPAASHTLVPAVIAADPHTPVPAAIAADPHTLVPAAIAADPAANLTPVPAVMAAEVDRDADSSFVSFYHRKPAGMAGFLLFWNRLRYTKNAPSSLRIPGRLLGGVKRMSSV